MSYYDSVRFASSGLLNIATMAFTDCSTGRLPHLPQVEERGEGWRGGSYQRYQKMQGRCKWMALATSYLLCSSKPFDHHSNSCD
jgi:hypothetical protein